MPVRILLDECLPRRLKRGLLDHEVRTVPEMGWASKRNGDLLSLAEGRFDAFVTVDRNLSFQQDVNRFNIAIVVLVANGNKESDLRPLVPRLLEALTTAVPGQVIRVDSANLG